MASITSARSVSAGWGGGRRTTSAKPLMKRLRLSMRAVAELGALDAQAAGAGDAEERGALHPRQSAGHAGLPQQAAGGGIGLLDVAVEVADDDAARRGADDLLEELVLLLRDEPLLTQP